MIIGAAITTPAATAKPDAMRVALVRAVVALAGGAVGIQVAAHLLVGKGLCQRNRAERQADQGQPTICDRLLFAIPVSRSCTRR